MQKQRENVFHEKFSLLNSQENSEDIKWTSSNSSSDYENTSAVGEKICTTTTNRNRKRKRKRKLLKNISNLDVTIIDSSQNTNSRSKSDLVRETSPILSSKCNRVSIPVSPILTSKIPPNESVNISPILPNRTLKQKSPILKAKSLSPFAAKVRKKLCYHNHVSNSISNIKHEESDKEADIKNNITGLPIKEEFIEINSYNIKSSTESSSLENKSNSNQAKSHLIDKVKSFFDSHFSSESTSQNITDTPTTEESSKNDDTIEILSCKTQSFTSHLQIKRDISNSDNSSFLEKSNKKVKYKKGGLAHRLHGLVKKQNSQICLWQHERFLAENSSFVIPKEESVTFYIQNVTFKYGCYLIEALDVNRKQYFVVINSIYVKNNIKDNFALKLYEPYTIINLDNNFKIITNVCKFECVDLSII